jgi:hypothetical protein
MARAIMVRLFNSKRFQPIERVDYTLNQWLSVSGGLTATRPSEDYARVFFRDTQQAVDGPCDAEESAG